MTQLTIDEIDVLMEALDEWENKGAVGEIMGTMLTAMVARDEQERDRLMAEREMEMRDKELAKKQRKEQSILLKAKLIRMRDHAEIDELEL